MAENRGRKENPEAAGEAVKAGNVVCANVVETRVAIKGRKAATVQMENREELNFL